jgi:multicomponent Na+:H+ antiporter subunit C
VTYLPYALAAWLFLIGLYGLVTSRNLIHLVVCLSVLQSSTYVLLLAIGYVDGGTAPILSGVARSARKVDPVVQALTLTDIVVGVAITALVLTIAVDAHRRTGSVDPDELQELRG